jgi:hypothetical protein
MIHHQRRIPEAHRTGGLAHVMVIAANDDLRNELAGHISKVDGVEVQHAETAHKAIQCFSADCRTSFWRM